VLVLSESASPPTVSDTRKKGRRVQWVFLPLFLISTLRVAQLTNPIIAVVLGLAGVTIAILGNRAYLRASNRDEAGKPE